MQEFIRTGFQLQELALLSQWKMWLQVSYLLDMCNGQGNHIQKEYLEGLEKQTYNTYGPGPKTSGLQVAGTARSNTKYVHPQPMMTPPMKSWELDNPTQHYNWMVHRHNVVLLILTQKPNIEVLHKNTLSYQRSALSQPRPWYFSPSRHAKMGESNNGMTPQVADSKRECTSDPEKQASWPWCWHWKLEPLFYVQKSTNTQTWGTYSKS